MDTTPGASDLTSVHKKEAEENQVPHFAGHVKMSAEQNIFISEDNTISIAEQIEHQTSDHNTIASEKQAYERIKAEGDFSTSLIRTKSAHISAEGEEYERFKKAFHYIGGVSLGSSQEGDNDPFIGLRHKRNGSMQIKAGIASVTATAYFMWMFC